MLTFPVTLILIHLVNLTLILMLILPVPLKLFLVTPIYTNPPCNTTLILTLPSYNLNPNTSRSCNPSPHTKVAHTFIIFFSFNQRVERKKNDPVYSRCVIVFWQRGALIDRERPDRLAVQKSISRSTSVQPGCP